jgi:hypothetical protein
MMSKSRRTLKVNFYGTNQASITSLMLVNAGHRRTSAP